MTWPGLLTPPHLPALTTNLVPGDAIKCKYPLNTKFSTTTSPSVTNVEFAEIDTFDGNGNLADISDGNTAQDGFKTI